MDKDELIDSIAETLNRFIDVPVLSEEQEHALAYQLVAFIFSIAGLFTGGEGGK